MDKKRGEKLYAQVFRQLRAHIIRNNLQPGDLLPTEQALVEMLGVSRNVLREAIKSMELMGLVSAQAGRGTVLKDFNLDFVFQNLIFAGVGSEESTIADMLAIRKRLELGFMRAAYATLRPEDVGALERLMSRIREEWESSGQFYREDRAFHRLLFSRVGNPTLLSLMEAIWDVDENFKTGQKAPHLEETITKHENIVRALKARNEEAFEATMLSHFASGKYLRRDDFSEV